MVSWACGAACLRMRWITRRCGCPALGTLTPYKPTCSGLKPLLREQSHRIQTYSSRVNKSRRTSRKSCAKTPTLPPPNLNRMAGPGGICPHAVGWPHKTLHSRVASRIPDGPAVSAALASIRLAPLPFLRPHPLRDDAHREPSCPRSTLFRSSLLPKAPSRSVLERGRPRKGSALQQLRCPVLPPHRGAVRGRRHSGALDRAQRAGRDGHGTRRRRLVRRAEQRADELRHLRNASGDLSQVRDGRALLPRCARRSQPCAAFRSHHSGALRGFIDVPQVKRSR